METRPESLMISTFAELAFLARLGDGEVPRVLGRHMPFLDTEASDVSLLAAAQALIEADQMEVSSEGFRLVDGRAALAHVLSDPQVVATITLQEGHRLSLAWMIERDDLLVVVRPVAPGLAQVAIRDLELETGVAAIAADFLAELSPRRFGCVVEHIALERSGEFSIWWDPAGDLWWQRASHADGQAVKIPSGDVVVAVRSVITP